MICVPIAESSFSEVVQHLDSCEKRADMAEIRLDAISGDISARRISELISRSSVPLIFTCRCSDEGGAFRGEETERIACLREAVHAGAAFIDVELRTDAALRDTLVQYAHDSTCRVIISWHDFSGTPPEAMLSEVLEQQISAGADIAKIVTMAQNRADILRLFSLYYPAFESDIPLISFCMGDAGRISRIACLAMGAFLSFASMDAGLETAPGQIPLGQFREILDAVM